MLINLTDTLPKLEPQGVMLRGERFYIRNDFSSDELREFRRLVAVEDFATLFEHIILDNQGARLRELIADFPGPHATQLYLTVFLAAGFTREMFAGVI